MKLRRVRKRWATVASGMFLATTLVATACTPGGQGSADGGFDGSLRYVVPYNPGGSSDPAGREFARLLASELGTTEVVENLPGGDETIGVSSVVRSKPDATTLGLSSQAGIIVQPKVNPSLAFQTVDDYSPIVKMLDAPNAIFVGRDSPFHTLDDLIEAARARPGEISIASSGRLTSPMFAVAALEREAAIDLNLVPFSGGSGEAVLAAMSGGTDAASTTAAGQLGLVASGDLRPLAHTGDSSYDEQLPGAVSFEAAGFNVPYSASYVTVGPKDIDSELLGQVTDAAYAVANGEAWAKWCSDNGFQASPLRDEELRQWIADETAFADEAIAMSNDAG